MQPVLQQLGRGVVRLWICLGGRMTQEIVEVLRNRPQRDGWMLAMSDKERGALRIIRCPFPLLYCIMARSIANTIDECYSSLRQAGECSVCTMENNQWKTLQLRRIVIDSINDGQ